MFDSEKCKFTCSKCGSINVELKRSYPKKNGNFLFSNLRTIIDKMKVVLATKCDGPLGGISYVICKDCGHISMIVS